ncbi:MAG: RluA family pseudouridine synthase, partial [Vicinamibacteria bacterium]
MVRRHIVTAHEAGSTLAALVRQNHEGVSWSRAQRLCQNGQVLVDGAPQTDPAFRVSEGQEVRIEPSRPRERELAAAIVFEDTHVVVDKPVGVSSVPYEKRERGTEISRIREAWRRQGRGATGLAPLFVVHRIDKETSGLTIFARTKTGERSLARQFREHTVERTYLAVAHGTLRSRRIESRLVADRRDGLRGSTRSPREGKRAVTHVRVVERLVGATLCRVRLETGRTHQIRIHLAEAGHPIVGERVYIRDFVARGGTSLASSRLLLHAATLAFEHPVTGRPVALAAPLPPDFLVELDRLRSVPRPGRSGAREKDPAGPSKDRRGRSSPS